jgi:hypothetical protein
VIVEVRRDCRVCARLFVKLQRAAQLYGAAVKRWTENMEEPLALPAYFSLKVLANDKWLDYEVARLELEKHRLGCGRP